MAVARFVTHFLPPDHERRAELPRLIERGNAALIGTGFGVPRDLRVGTDGAMYISQEDPEVIYRVSPLPCPWDLDGDNNVGTGDLILLLGSWGDPYGTADLIELLGNWGPCPK